MHDQAIDSRRPLVAGINSHRPLDISNGLVKPLSSPIDSRSTQGSISSTTYVYPDGWDDDRLMCVRFADAPNPSIDPHGYDAHMMFWSTAIISFVRHNRTLHFSIDEVEQRLTRVSDGTLFRPEGIQEVVRHQLQQGQLLTAQTFIAPPSIVRSLWNFVSTGLYTHMLAKQPSLPSGPFFFVDIVKDFAKHIAETILSTAVGEVDLIVSYQELRALVARQQGCEIPSVVSISSTSSTQHAPALRRLELDTKIVAQQLVRDGMAVLFSCEAHSMFIKFSSNKTNVSLSESDKNIANLKYTISFLHENIALLDEKREAKMSEVKLALRAKTKRLAKWHLAGAKTLEREVDQRSQQLHNLESLLLRISSSHSNREVFGAMKLAAQSVSQIQRECGIESTQEFMADLEETLDDASEMDRALTQNINNGSDDTEVLEQELARLDDAQHTQRVEADLALPSVPRMRMPDKPSVQQPIKFSVSERQNTLLT